VDEMQLVQARELLLAAGVAPRHVKRTVRELRDHRSDLLEQLQADGMEYGSASLEAETRLGSVEALVDAVLARPELCSFSKRYPAVVFVLLPALLYLVLTVAGVLGIFFYVGHYFSSSPPAFSPTERLFVASTLSFARSVVEWGVPALLAIYFAQLAAHRHVRSWWIFLGVMLIAELGSIPILNLEISETERTVTGGIGFNYKGFQWLTWRALAVAGASLTTYLIILRHNSRRLRPQPGLSSR